MSDTKTIVKVKPTTSELAATVRKDIKIDAKTGVGTIKENWYVENLGLAVPEAIKTKYPGIENDMVPIIEGLQDHNTVLAAAVGLAFGEESEHVMKKHKELERTTLDLPTTGKDGFDFVYDRTKKVTDPTADGGTKITHGALSVGYRTYGTKNRGELAKVKTLLKESAASVFSS
ncbi:hypothetical protein [Paraburkholderia sp. BCC1886]|uniref:hypothetical protein n=1 Tax=Paraburkholderia sp. BCC1886 TaxID=2562670 RepID=UPI001182AF85|nr:hypothetical protein [Paraburkholderia sp. BCC1886]